MLSFDFKSWGEGQRGSGFVQERDSDSCSEKRTIAENNNNNDNNLKRLLFHKYCGHSNARKYHIVSQGRCKLFLKVLRIIRIMLI